jgi:hypothetical protein
MIAEVLRRCGDDLTRKNLIRQATSIRDFQLPMFVLGVTINTSPDSRIGWRQGRMAQFDGSAWQFVTDADRSGGSGSLVPSSFLLRRPATGTSQHGLPHGIVLTIMHSRMASYAPKPQILCLLGTNRVLPSQPIDVMFGPMENTYARHRRP